VQRIGNAALILGFVLGIVGCGQNSAPPPVAEQKPPEKAPSTDEEKALAELPAASRKRAELQKVCAVSGEPLGSMGKPVELMIENQPVFLCCEHCRKSALKDPKKTLDKVKELTAKK
jgi:hypothetical protein